MCPHDIQHRLLLGRLEWLFLFELGLKLIYDKAIQESDYQAACAIAIVNVALSLGLFGLYRFAARRLGG